MARFNQTVVGSEKTTNYEGAVAYKTDAKTELYSAVVCALLQPKFYVPKAQDAVDQIAGLVKLVPKDFISKLLVYSREKMYLRSVPLVLAVEAAKCGKLDYRVASRIIQRADEITEVLAYYQSANGRKGAKKLGKLSNSIKKAVGEAFNKFDEYQFAKYNRGGEVKLRDALFISHPKPKDDKQAGLFKKIASDSLEIPYTWETELSAKGNKAEVWEELINSNKLGYMALLRNLRNILDSGVGDTVLQKVATDISDPARVKKSRQYPFRFYSAWKAVGEKHSGFNANPIKSAIEKAAVESVSNFPFVDNEKIVVAIDISGSMNNPISEKSEVNYWEIGAVLGGSVAAISKNNVVMAFNNQVYNVTIPNPHPFSVANALRASVGGGTDGWRVPAVLEHEKIVPDWVFVFTDMQMWGDQEFSKCWNRYRTNVAPNVKLVLFDLAGYGKTPISTREKDVYLISGWSEEIFNVLSALGRGSSAIKEIDSIEI